tara:strand:+ start:38 stop:1483 length:1446 start_codon:yes stop_codon:yes gene_type:complete
MQAEQNEENYSLPIGMRYNLGIADSVPAERNITQYVSSNATSFSGEGTNVCRIPVSSGNFLDLNHAVIQFDFKNTTATDVQLDGSAACVIEQIDIIAGGQTIETVRHYNQLDCVLDQYVSSQGTLRQNAILKGGVEHLDETPRFDALAAPTGAAVTNNGITVSGSTAGNMNLSSVGGIGYDQKQTTILATGKSRRFTFPLRGVGFLNPSTSKMLPPNTPFQLSVTFARSANCLVELANNAMTYAVSDCELHIPEVRILDPTFMSRMNQRMAQGLAWKTVGYDHFVNTVAKGTGVTTVQISARARSLKGLMTILRNQDNVSANNKFKLSKRSINYTSEFSYRIGSNQFPSQPARIGGVGAVIAANTRINKATDGLNVGESYSHAMRLFGNLNKSGSDCLISQESFAQSEANNGTGILAIDLSAFSDASVNSGMNTLNNLPVSLEINRTAAANAVASTIQVDTYSVHELVIIRDPSGQLSSLY